MIPKMIAPSGRIARATVSVNAISGRVRPKDLAMSSMTRVRMKKSNASSVQPRKPASTAFHWFVRSTFVIAAGAAAVAMIAREGDPTASPRHRHGPRDDGVARTDHVNHPHERFTANRADFPASIRTISQIQLLEAQLAAPHDPIVRDEHARNRSEAARVAQQPRVDVARWIGQQLPR